MSFLTLLVTLTIVSTAIAVSELLIIEAGKNGKEGPVLLDGFSFCPTSFSKRGFSIECRIEGAKSASLYFAGDFEREENVRPFMIRGDSNGYVYAWEDFQWGEHNIGCMGDNDAQLSATGWFRCDSKSTPMPKRESEPTHAPEPPRGWEKPSSPIGVDQAYCVTKKGTDYSGRLQRGWEARGTAVWYKPWDNYGGVTGPQTSILEYYVTVPVKSVYSFVLDMTTMHWTEHNDVWVSINAGFSLRKAGAWGPRGRQFFKAYHNENGRAKKAFSVDFNAHAFSTQTELLPGKKYKVSIGARSTKTGINGIIMFPCEGAQCVHTSSHWNHYLRICHV